MREVFRAFLFPLPGSVFAAAVPAVCLTIQGMGGIAEVIGRNAKYSKFFQSGKSHSRNLPSKVGMAVAYSPAAMTATMAALFFNKIWAAPRVALVASMLAIHFFKRFLEIMFLHRYSDGMAVETVTTITLSYLFLTAYTIYAQWLTEGTAAPSVDLKLAGVSLFAVGICGNLYHHVLLCKLRKGGERQYTIPRGGLFSLVTCPHYLFEIVIFAGIACASQTVFSISVMAGTAFYLAGRSLATRKWYFSKFPGYPRRIKALVPYLF